VHGSGFRAFRTPSMNELYRTGQVGQETTLANAKLLSERATGAEGGVSVHAARVSAQATYFWTEVNRPVAAVLVSSTATTILEMRQNLGQFQSQGLETSVQVNEGHAISATFGYQYAHAVVTKFSVQTSLVGKWIPDVPRETATAQVRFRSARLGALTIAARNSGRAFDDSANTFVLHSFFQLDAYGERSLGRGFTAFVSVQNVLDRRADVARTPVLTQGIPVVAQGGIRFGWGG
jgi:outer membrane receptor protein involved in Fe transport